MINARAIGSSSAYRPGRFAHAVAVKRAKPHETSIWSSTCSHDSASSLTADFGHASTEISSDTAATALSCDCFFSFFGAGFAAVFFDFVDVVLTVFFGFDGV